jgi:hypothetical protein
MYFLMFAEFCRFLPIFSPIFAEPMFSGPLPSFCRCRVFPLGSSFSFYFVIAHPFLVLEMEFGQYNLWS